MVRKKAVAGCIIGILNIINMVYSNVHSRVGKIGMQRAVGMSAVSLCAILLWEGACDGIFASVIGAVLGYCCVFADAAQTDTMQRVVIPLHSITKRDIVLSIERVG